MQTIDRILYDRLQILVQYIMYYIRYILFAFRVYVGTKAFSSSR